MRRNGSWKGSSGSSSSARTTTAGRPSARVSSNAAGTEGLNRLWEREEMLPTVSELEAPGLWLARIELPD